MIRTGGLFEDIIYVFEYDDNGHRTSQATYSSDEISNRSTLFRYDDKGLCVEESWLDGEGNLDALVTMKYNDAGGLIEYLMYDSEGDIVEVFYAEYDEHGNMIEKHDSRSKGHIRRTTSTSTTKRVERLSAPRCLTHSKIDLLAHTTHMTI